MRVVFVLSVLFSVAAIAISPVYAASHGACSSIHSVHGIKIGNCGSHGKVAMVRKTVLK